MPRLARRLRTPALALAALGLWLLPKGVPGRPAPATPPAEAEVPAAAAAASAVPPPAGPLVHLAENTARSPRAYSIALDELYLPAKPAGARLAALAPVADLDAHLARAAELAAAAPDHAAPRLVLYPAGAPRNAATRRVLTPRLEVVLASADAPLPAARPELGIVSWRRAAYAPDRAIARIAGDAGQPLRALAAVSSWPGLRSARPLLARQHFPKFVPDDPLFGQQWHLRNTGQQGGKRGADIRAVPAWDTATGAGVVIGIVDDGVDYTHPDLAPAYRPELGYDWNGDTNGAGPDADPAPANNDIETGDHHGTAVAGLALARGDNSVGVSGAAPAASLAALRLIAAPTTDDEDAEAMLLNNEAIFIKNNSWGPPDADLSNGYLPTLEPAGEAWAAAVATAVATGRDGLGTLFFWAAGNGHADGDQGSLDGYASARPVIPVATTSHRGGPAFFSEAGPHLVVAAPGDARFGLVTTDRPGALGFNPPQAGHPADLPDLGYTRTFNGSSASAPLAAGVAALLLETRPDLGWRDVKEILLRSSTKLMGGSRDWTSRPAGDTARPIKHHPRLGGGLLNALDALSLARDWTPLGAETLVEAELSLAEPQVIPDVGTVVVRRGFLLPGDAPLLRVEHVVLTLDVEHPYRGDLDISLVSPAGVVSRFVTASNRMDGLYEDVIATPENEALIGANYENTPFNSVRHWGEASALPDRPDSLWTLEIRDRLKGHVGRLLGARLALYGTPIVQPAVILDPEDQALATGSTLVLRAAFSGGNLAYRWTRNGVPLRGADRAELRVPGFSAKTAGTYVCTATNEAGFETVSATVTVDDSPRATFTMRAGASTALELDELVSGEVVLWKAAGLPKGLVLDPATGSLAGRPTKPGSYRAIVTATTSDGRVVRTPLAFVIDPIPADLAGSYVGLVSRDDTLNAALGGSFNFTVNAGAAVTGRVVLGGVAHAFSGLLDGQSENDITLDVSLPKPGLRLLLQISREGDLATCDGTLRPLDGGDAAPVATLSGARSSWHARSRPASEFAGVAAAAFVPDADDAPGMGATVATFTVSTAGRATWLITPADGAPARTGSVPLSDGGVLFLHALYAKSLGSVQGSLLLPTTEFPAFSPLSTLSWLRKASTALAVPEGFPALELVPASGSGRYAKPASGERILGRSESDAALEAKVAPTVAQLAAAAPLDVAITLSAANRFLVAAPNSPTLSLTFAPATGRITGAFVDGEGRKNRLTATVLPHAEPARALGFAFAPGTAGIAPAESVGFELTPGNTE